MSALPLDNKFHFPPAQSINALVSRDIFSGNYLVYTIRYIYNLVLNASSRLLYGLYILFYMDYVLFVTYIGQFSTNGFPKIPFDLS